MITFSLLYLERTEEKAIRPLTLLFPSKLLGIREQREGSGRSKRVKIVAVFH